MKPVYSATFDILHVFGGVALIKVPLLLGPIPVSLTDHAFFFRLIETK